MRPRRSGQRSVPSGPGRETRPARTPRTRSPTTMRRCAPLAWTRSRRGTIVGRNARSAVSKNVVSTAIRNATSSSWGSDSQPPNAAMGIVARSAARPRSAQIITGRRRRRSTHAPATRPTARPGDQLHAPDEGDTERVRVESQDRDEWQREPRDEAAEDRDRGRAPDAPKRGVAPQRRRRQLVGRRKVGIEEGFGAGHRRRVRSRSQPTG